MIDYPIDLVIPYVNCTSKKWQETYVDFCENNGYKERVQAFNSERYRDWGFFKYMLRGVSANMQFVNKVYLLLQAEDQIPDWLDTSSLEIVYHKDFIPEKFLPTYNSTTIEMFLDNILGLSEHFIYANDDLYALKPMQASDFFTDDGKIKMGFRKRVLKDYLQFNLVCCHCFNEIQLLTNGRDTTPDYLTPFHEFMPMIKSHVTKVKELLGDRITNGITPFRDPRNHNQYIFPYYEFFTNNTAMPERTYAYLNMENDIDTVRDVLINRKESTLVLNDNEKTNVKLWSTNRDIRVAFEVTFYKMGKFEKKPKVTIGICMYNAAEYIGACIDSIPKRDDLEILIIDDACIDNSAQIVNEKLRPFKKYAMLKSNKNSGVGFCRNALLEMANGEYIFFLDADDKIDTEVFNNIIDNELTDQNILMPKYIRNDGFSGYPTILRGCFIKRSYIGDVKHDPCRRCFEDVDFKRKLAESKNGKLDITKSKETIYFYNMPRIGSLTWEHYKSAGLPGYQRGEENWEKWYKGKAR